MTAPDTSNEYFQLAARFVNQTNRHIFLTGRAGTGKTTFLKYIQAHSVKKMAIVAPTGVAAINAGGVTMHSFFQLPFGPFLPARQGWQDPNIAATDQHTLIKNLRFNNAKRELLRELELLVIDEVSMVRADMLDAIDLILRHFRRQPHTPFGGLQVLFIGDLFQLPPVVTNEEWDGILKYHYASPFFFDSYAVRQAPPLYLELKKIYRQNEAAFIDILNNLRTNSTTEEDLRQLHLRYIPGFVPDEDEHFITLTSHNYKADKINQYQLARLPGEVHEFKGEITGDFNEKALPADRLLQLKVGAQIMFIKNDKGEFRRFFNGKLAIIQSISKDKITVSFPGEDIELDLEQETWKNIRYSYNKEKDAVEEEELGSFKQYPIRLAWAITIHKSQGLTFRRAIVDAGESFAPGQVYVALSRLTSMDGLVLYSRIQPHCISTDERVIAFTSAEMEADELKQALQEERKHYVGRTIVQCFDWTRLTAAWEAHYEGYEDRQLPDQTAAVVWARAQVIRLTEHQEVAQKFMRQLEQLLADSTAAGYAALQQRLQAAIAYFTLQLQEVDSSLQQHLDEVKVKSKVRKYVKELQALQLLLGRQRQLMEQAAATVQALAGGTHPDEVLTLVEEKKKAAGEALQEAVALAEKPTKGETRFISLRLFKEGNTIDTIAAQRGMATSTIEGHLIQFVATGEIAVEELVPEHKIGPILLALKETGGHSSTPVKEKLGDEYSFGEIKAVMQYRNRLQQQKA